VIDKFNPYRSHLALPNNEQIQGFEIPSLARSAAMVVFSACQTNVSVTSIGQATEPGFARGLTMFAHAAGARWVVSTLWKADEDASRVIMVAYYRLLLSGEPPALALFHAKKQFIKDNPQKQSPWHWAGYASSALVLADLAVHD